ncbi:molybdopterin-dependent oxidoreductase [Lentisphaera profundi]|uniref:Molybdopterin-dependent oxidoreductase n=1 Tax=Lentisphaera profundi TaxID=1658616 RepID=A0ABY7VN48_9BACT|nr:nitrate reductase [Lentisphaera profundi]WDE95510.1 molybdopterin-dependent oxidoreductase [Lentisphaera profundi]
MKNCKTTCSYCGVGCGISLSKDKDDFLELEGNEQYPVNEGMLCSKGMNLHNVVMDKSDRLLEPQMRSAKHHQLQNVSWDTAMTRAAAVFKSIIKKYGPDSVGLYVSGQLLTEEYYLANKLTKGFLGTNNIDTNSRLCMSSAVVGYKKTIGDDTPPISYEDIEHSDCFFIAGANPAWCHPILFRRIEKRKEQFPDTKIIVVDPRKTQSAEMADLHLPLIPGTDVYLFNAIAKLLVQYGAVDYNFLELHCNGGHQLLEFLKDLDLNETAQACGLELSLIEQAARLIADSKTLLSMWTMGLNQSSIGTNKNLALINLNLLTGRIGKAGSGPFSLTGQPNAMGGREVGGLSNLLAAHHDLDNPAHCNKVANYWGCGSVQSKPGLSATEMIDALDDGRLKAIWIICTNPAVSLPNLEKVERAYKKAKFVMVSDISSKSDTLKFADMILPAAGWAEKEGTMTNSERRVSHLPKIIDPPGNARPDVDILKHFAQKMGWEDAFTYPNEEAIFDEHKELTRGTNIDICGITYDRLKKKSIQWPCPSEDHPGTKRLFEDFKFFTPDKKAKVHVVEPEHKSEKTCGDYPLILTTGRIRDQWHTMTRTGKVQRLNQHTPAPKLEIHPDDAAKLKILDGENVEITSRRSSVIVASQVSTAIRPGTVFLPMHWGYINKSNKARANNLTSDIIDPISKEPDFKFSAVKVQALSKKKRKIVLVGAGAAALEFIHSYRKVNEDDEIHVFGREPHLFYNRVLLPDYINNEKSWEAILLSEAQELTKLKVNYHQGNAIEKVSPESKKITDAKGETHSYDTLILATGSRPTQTMKTPKNMQGFFGLRTRRDADLIKSYLKDGGKAVIIGGGLLGLELAGSLASLGIEVTIIQRSSRLMRGQLDDMGSDILHDEITRRNIEIIYNDEVSKFEGDTHLKAIELKSGKKLDCDALFFAAGIKPNSELGQDAGLKCDRGIIVNDQLLSSDPNIFAMGEIAQHRNKTYGTTPSAQDQARVVSAYLNGDRWATYKGSLSFNILKLKDLQLASLGQVRKPEGPEYDEITLIDRRKNYYKKCILRNDVLIGAILIGDKSEFNHFKDLIEQKIELADQRLPLLKGSAEPTEAPIGEIICSCNNVGVGNIENIIGEGCCDFEQICTKSGAGTGCGSCRPEVKRILMKSIATQAEEVKS